MNKTISLIIAAGIVYFLIQMKMGEKSSNLNQSAETHEEAHSEHSENKSNLTAPNKEEIISGNLLEKTLSSVMLNVLKTPQGRAFFENIIQLQNKPITGEEYSFQMNGESLINSIFRINSFGNGEIGPASCGHVVTVQYQILNMQNHILEENTKTFSLGAKTVSQGIDAVVVGMLTGQTRQAIIPARYSYNRPKAIQNNSQFLDQNESYKVNVTLQEILPKNFIDKGIVKIFDDEINYKIPLVCGDVAKFHAKIIDLSNNSVVYDSKNKMKHLEMTIGDITFPMIFSHALHGKTTNGTRTVITTGKFFQSLGINTSAIFPQEQLPVNKYFMLELNDFIE